METSMQFLQQYFEEREACLQWIVTGNGMCAPLRTCRK